MLFSCSCSAQAPCSPFPVSILPKSLPDRQKPVQRQKAKLLFLILPSTRSTAPRCAWNNSGAKKIIVLNVASKCGYTPQYADWEKFYSEHKDNTVVLGFPCNDFMGQEPGSAEEIAAFCESNYHISFPLFEKVHVKGDEKAPLYRWLTDPAQNGWNSQEPTWNFSKYLINEKGELTHFFASKVKPDSPEFLAAYGK